MSLRQRGRQSRRSMALTALVTGGLVLASLGATVDASSASAATAGPLVPAIHDCDTYEGVQGPNSFAVDFNYSAQLQHWVVPPNVAGGSVCVDVSGGQGGAGSGSAGGFGGAVNQLFAVSPGQTYTISTGALGFSSTTSGGTGGGGTFVFDSAHHLLLARAGAAGAVLLRPRRVVLVARAPITPAGPGRPASPKRWWWCHHRGEAAQPVSSRGNRGVPVRRPLLRPSVAEGLRRRGGTGGGGYFGGGRRGRTPAAAKGVPASARPSANSVSRTTRAIGTAGVTLPSSTGRPPLRLRRTVVGVVSCPPRVPATG